MTPQSTTHSIWVRSLSKHVTVEAQFPSLNTKDAPLAATASARV